MNLLIVHGILVCSSFLISLCTFIVPKALLISIVQAGGAIWLNPFATVLFIVCNAVTVECCVVLPPVFAWVCVVCLQLCKEEKIFSSGGRIWACMRCPCLCLCWVLGCGSS